MTQHPVRLILLDFDGTLVDTRRANARAYIATLKTEKRRLHSEVLADIEQIAGVVFLEGL